MGAQSTGAQSASGSGAQAASTAAMAASMFSIADDASVADDAATVAVSAAATASVMEAEEAVGDSSERTRLRGDAPSGCSMTKCGALLRTMVMPNLATTVSAASMADASALTASSTVAFKAATEASAVLKPSASIVVVVVVVDIWFDGFDCFPTLLWTST